VNLGDGAGGGVRRLSLDGLTDAKVRVLGRLVPDRLWLTFGVSLPTGTVGLTDDEFAAIRTLGAPALRMTTPVLGGGTGFIAGAVFTTTVGPWAVGLGASYELRASYTPLDASLAGGGGSIADLDPAGAMHLSLGFDRVVGQGRMSLLFSGDRYGTDLVTTRVGTGAATQSRYRLGPSVAVQWNYVLATPAVREIRLAVSDHFRFEFSDAAGDRVAGSRGNTLDLGVSVIVGRAGSMGLVLGIDGAFDSGLDLDNTVATAAITSAALTAGLDLPVGRVALRPFVRGTVGRLDLGPETTGATGVGGGVLLRTEW
jgi:hypothetical protein